MINQVFFRLRSKLSRIIGVNPDLVTQGADHNGPKLKQMPTSVEQLEEYAHNSPGLIRLHLGCGQRYFSGYVNIDYPQSHHTVQAKSLADLYADIRKLRFSPQTIAEVRLHHVFEHFDRPKALRLLVDWHEWLIEGGILLIETPDFDACARIILSPWKPWPKKAVAMRHLYGSHEAHWAYHLEGWNKQRLSHTLTELGFVHLKLQRTRWQGTRNIIVKARKDSVWPREKLNEVVRKLLSESLVDQAEKGLYEVWTQKAGCDNDDMSFS